MKTTLNKIREHSPCASGWEKLLSYLGKTKADDEEISVLTILDSNGLEDALWCLRSVEGYDREIRLFAVWCVRQVQHLLTDKRSLDALDVAERYANGEATDAELAAARDAAWEAIRDTADAAWDAAAPAAAAAAAAAAGDAAGDAAWSAAWAAAWDAAAPAAAPAAAAAAPAAAPAAAAAAAAAAGAAARAAAWAAWDAAEAAAWVAREAAREIGIRQAAELRRICEEE